MCGEETTNLQISVLSFLLGFKATRSYEACLQANAQILNSSDITLVTNEVTNFTVYNHTLENMNEVTPLLMECNLQKEIEKVKALSVFVCLC